MAADISNPRNSGDANLVSASNQRFAAELAALRPTRQSRIGLRTEGIS